MSELLEQPRQIRKFNPGTFQSDREVIDQFVVRNRELGIVLDVLRRNAGSPSCQHVLLVAPRGRGKTMLLARVAAELRTDGDLSEQFLPIRFMEESQEIFNLGDFWLELLFYLAREHGVRDPDLSRELRDVHAALAAEWRGRELEERARAAVLEIADRLGKQLVLMVENLQSLCRDVDQDFGWKLRGVLQSEPQIILLATATSRFVELDDAEHAFFELFRIVRLEPLDTGECRRLWQMVTGDDVREPVIRPLQILTGGDPRLLVIIGEFAQHQSLRQLMEDLVRLIDDHTEYFRAHLEGFAKTERRVYLALIDLWRPSTTGEIAARARLDVRTVSTLLGRLVGRGAVIVEGNGGKRVYAAAQRLYSIYYKLRRERDEATVVRNLIHFMAVLYSDDEPARRMAERLTWEAVQSPTIREGIERAIAEAPHIGRFFSHEEWKTISQASERATAMDDKDAMLSLRGIVAEVDETGNGQVIEIMGRGRASPTENSPHAPEPVTALALWRRAVAHGNLGEYEAASAIYDQLVAYIGDSDVPELQVQVATALIWKGITQGQLGDAQAEMSTYDEVTGRFGSPRWSARDTQGQLATHRGSFDECRAIWGQRRARASGAATALVNKGVGDAQDVHLRRGGRRFGDSDVPELQVQARCSTRESRKDSRRRTGGDVHLRRGGRAIWGQRRARASGARAGAPQRWSTRESRKDSSATPRRRCPPTTRWSGNLGTATCPSFRCRSPGPSSIGLKWKPGSAARKKLYLLVRSLNEGSTFWPVSKKGRWNADRGGLEPGLCSCWNDTQPPWICSGRFTLRSSRAKKPWWVRCWRRCPT